MIPLENPQILPNAVFAPQFIIQTAIIDGVLKTSATITVQSARCDNGVWTYTVGQTAQIYVPDIYNLDIDISALQPSVTQMYASLAAVVGTVNSIRKLL